MKDKEDRHRLDRKFYCKLEVIYNKYTPVIVSVIVTLDNYMDIEDNYIHSLAYLFVPSTLTLIHMYISRGVLGFCRLHRIFVNYTLVNVLFRIWQCIPFLPTFNIFIWHSIYTIAFLIFFILLIYEYVTTHKKTTTQNS